MKLVSLQDEQIALDALIELAREEPVLLLTADGRQFVLTEADDFDQEVESLRKSPAFQRFLDDRLQCNRRIPLEEIEAEIERELKAGKEAP
jgi:hypothetical protein